MPVSEIHPSTRVLVNRVLIALLLVICSASSAANDNATARQRFDESWSAAKRYEAVAVKSRWLADNLRRMSNIAGRMDWTGTEEKICAWLRSTGNYACANPIEWNNTKDAYEDIFIKKMNVCQRYYLDAQYAPDRNLSDLELTTILARSVNFLQDKNCYDVEGNERGFKP